MAQREIFHKLLIAGLCSAACASASSISLPGGTLTLPGISTTGVSFVFTGTLTQADTLFFTESGNPCLQSPPSYCVNGAGVVTTAGTLPVGAASTFTGTFNGSTKTWDFGAILMEISGEGAVQIFPANAAAGLGSSTPPLSLTLSSTSLGALGFPNFSVLNPTITFVMADTLYSDNSGQFVISQIPEPGTNMLVAAACMLAGLAIRRQRRSRA
jgi:hypothetical protein